MDIDKTITFLENSFLKELFTKKDITDISYNGKDIYYVDNYLGRLTKSLASCLVTETSLLRRPR